MKRRILCVVFVVAFAIAAVSQTTKIVIPAGTPEDKALQAITAENDAQKRIAMLEQFVKDFSANPQAMAYGYSQLSQAYQNAAEYDKALSYADKAATAMPTNMDILVAAAGVAQSTKDNGKVVDYAVRGGTAYNGIATQKKPEGMSDADFSAKISDDQRVDRQSYEFLEAAAYNAIGEEKDAKKRMSYIEHFTPAFPASKFEEQISQLAMVSLQELNDPARVISYGEKTLKANPESVPTLLLLANAYVEDPKSVAKAVEYAGKAAKVSKGESADATAQQKLSAGMAKSTLGYALLKQGKQPAAIPELKRATELLADNPGLQAEALYRLAFGYASMAPPKRVDARAALQKAIAIPGPYQAMAQDLLNKVNAPPKK